MGGLLEAVDEVYDGGHVGLLGDEVEGVGGVAFRVEDGAEACVEGVGGLVGGGWSGRG